MTRIIYLGYYLRKLDWKLYRKFLLYTANDHYKSKFRIQLDILLSVFKYNISILEYFQFGFITKTSLERTTYAGTGFMYEYQKKMNPKVNRPILEDKILFLTEFEDVSGRVFITLDDLSTNPDRVQSFFSKPVNKVVLKPSKGGSGKNLYIIEDSHLTPESLKNEMLSKNVDLAEGFVTQHQDLMRLSPSGLNTVRVITQIDKDGQVEVIAARLRISIDSPVDNLAAGNIVTAVDTQDGKVISNGFYSDITKEEVVSHPITGVKLKGYQIPFWQETIQLAIRSAHKVRHQNKSVGWDIGISNDGPVLIEGNHDWCKLVWQLPVGRGLKKKLEPYL